MINETLKFTNCPPSEKKKKTEPCSFKKKGHNTFAKCQPISACAGNGFNESTVW